MKNRGKGDMYLSNTTKDLLDLFMFASGLSDVFPKETLSVRSSNLIELDSHKGDIGSKENVTTIIEGGDTTTPSTSNVV